MVSVVSDFWKSLASRKLGSGTTGDGRSVTYGRAYNVPVDTHLRLFPSFDPTSVHLELPDSSKVIREGKTRSQPRSVPTVSKIRRRPAQLRRSVNFLIVPRGQPHKSQNIIRESSPDETFAEMARDGGDNLNRGELKAGVLI